MTLLQAVTLADPNQDADELAGTVSARLAYLVRRAEGLGDATAASKLAVATLWLDACETASFLGDTRTARRALRQAASALVAAGNPFGTTLRAAFLVERGTGMFVLEDEGAVLRTEGAAQAWAVFNSEGRAQWTEGLARHTFLVNGAERIGRLGWTLDEMLSVTTASPEERHGLFAARLSEQYRAVRNAQRNAYLWRRQLAPVPLFDLELAVLIRHGLGDRWGEVQSRWVAERVADPQLREFMDAYLQAVAALIQSERGNGTNVLVEERLR